MAAVHASARTIGEEHMPLIVALNTWVKSVAAAVLAKMDRPWRNGCRPAVFIEKVASIQSLC
jgi:hypothetical protein